MTDDKQEEPVTVFACGPSMRTCKCECPDGPCEHQWDGPWVEFKNDHDSEGLSGGSSSCSKCGMLSMDHDIWVLP